MLLIGRAMATLLRPSRSRWHDLVREPSRVQQLQVSRQDFVDRITRDQPDGGDLDHGAPGFGPIGFREANRQHRCLYSNPGTRTHSRSTAPGTARPAATRAGTPAPAPAPRPSATAPASAGRPARPPRPPSASPAP